MVTSENEQMETVIVMSESLSSGILSVDRSQTGGSHFQAGGKFAEDGRLKDEATRALIRELLVSLATWTRRLQAESSVAAAI